MDAAHPAPPRLAAVTVDCADPAALAAFWCAALGTSVRADWGGYVVLEPPASGGAGLGFQRVPEPRSGKNRVHVDLASEDRVGEVDRLVGLGATVVAEHVDEVPGLDWTTLADPEGNEFCVGQPHAGP